MFQACVERPSITTNKVTTIMNTSSELYDILDMATSKALNNNTKAEIAPMTVSGEIESLILDIFFTKA